MKVEVKFIRTANIVNNLYLPNKEYLIGDIVTMSKDGADAFAATGFVIHLNTDAAELETNEVKPKKRGRPAKVETK